MAGFGILNGLFSFEEKEVLNRVALGLGKEQCVEALSFGQESSDDEECRGLYAAVITKVQSLTVEDWKELQAFLPFTLPVSDDDFNFSEDMLLEEVL